MKVFSDKVLVRHERDVLVIDALYRLGCIGAGMNFGLQRCTTYELCDDGSWIYGLARKTRVLFSKGSDLCIVKRTMNI